MHACCWRPPLTSTSNQQGNCSNRRFQTASLASTLPPRMARGPQSKSAHARSTPGATCCTA
eukprot:2695924-Alexandrium_andersonii.AAC.1